MPERGNPSHIIYRPAKVRDVPALLAMYAEFFAESTLPKIGLVLDHDKVSAWATDVISTGFSPHIIAVSRGDGVIVGSVNYYIDNNITVQPYAFIDKFYVTREWRTAGVGGVLLELVQDAVKADGAIALRAGLSAGIRGAETLFAEHGFRAAPYSVLMEKEF